MRIALIVATAASIVCSAAAFTGPASASWFHSSATAQVSGQVVSAKDDSPLAGIHVLAVPAGTRTVEASAISDKSGRFTLRGLRGGQYRLVFDRAGYGQAYADGITVRSDDHLVMISPFAVPDVKLATIQQIALGPQCGNLIQPAETADVYVVCSGY